MREKIVLLLAAAVLGALLAGCGMKPDVSKAPGPVPAPETQAPAPEPSRKPDGQEGKNAPPELDSIAAQYVGAWRDAEDGASGGQCRMQIGCADGVYSIDINWSGGTGENTHWQYTGTYDEIWEGIDYIGTRYEESVLEDGAAEQTVGLEEATGLIYLDEDGAVLWEDTFEHRGDGMRFLRED